MTFEEMRVKLDATLISYRARILHNQGLGDHCIAKKLNISTKRVRSYLRGVYCVAKTPDLPKRICPESSRIWDTPVLRYSCSKERLRLNSEYHGRAYVKQKKLRKSFAA